MSSLVNEFARRVGEVLPPEFRRRGRKWSRSDGVLRQEVHTYRLMWSYGTSPCFRLELTVGLAAHRHCDIPIMGPTDWWIRSDRDAELQLTAAVDEAHAYLRAGGISWLEEHGTREGFAASFAHVRYPRCPLLVALALDNLDGIRTLLTQLAPIEIKSTWDRDLVLAEAILDGFARIEEQPAGMGLHTVNQMVRAYRGRPPKKERVLYEAVKARLEAISAR
ncbi:MAG: hypothetical protein ACKV2O_04600 [Acidimicrobiales bacterium]